MPKSSTPALLLTMVRSFVPLWRTAAMRFSGMPQRPKPPIRIVAPSWIFSMAASAEAMRLSMVLQSARREFTSSSVVAGRRASIGSRCLATGARSGDQSFHGSITGIHCGDQTVGSRSNVDEGIAALGHLASDHLFVVVFKVVALPVGRTAQFAWALRIVEANEEAVDVCGLVPPNHVKTIQLSGGTIRVEFGEEARAAGNQTDVRATMAGATVREELTFLHALRSIPIASERLREPVYLGA